MMDIDLPQSFYDSVKISTFLEVKAPDVIVKNAFWHDINDKPIDCNIYHPKYGSIEVSNKYGKFNVRLGFMTIEKQHVISTCSYVYQSYDTNETVYCQFSPLPMLCEHNDGRLTNKDGIEIKKVDWLRTHQTRKAIDVNDFAEIYQREFSKSGLPDSQINHITLKAYLEKEVRELITHHEVDRKYGSTLDLQVLAKANEFLAWLQKVNTSNEIKPKIYAVFHRLKIDLKIVIDFKRNLDEKYIKTEIMAFAESEYNQKEGQSFYRYFIDCPDLKNFTTNELSQLKKLANNDTDILSKITQLSEK